MYKPVNRKMQIFVRVLLRHKIESIALFTVIGILFMVCFGGLVIPFSVTALDLENKFIEPNATHWFGTDAAGRDVLSRVIAGSRVSMEIASLVILFASVVGVTIGVLAALNGGIVDDVLMRIADIFLSFPPLLLAIAIAAALGSGLKPAIIGLAITWWPGYARLIRAQVLVVKNESYVESAYAVGCSRLRVICKYMLLNAMDPLIVQMTLDVGYVTLTAAGLSFIGVGAQPPTAEWGLMVASGQRCILSQWWVSTFPGLVLFLTVLSFNLVGDMLRRILDPQLR